MLLTGAIIRAIRVGLVVSGEEYCLEWEAFSVRGQSIILMFLLDYISGVFFRTVLIISGVVIFYSSSYMIGDQFRSRFCILVLSFVIRMGLLIFRPRLVCMLLGWDGLGVTSYLLVCYYRREKRFNARILTALTNRIGDVAILVLIGIWRSHGLFNFGILRSRNVAETGLLFGLVVLAAITKRAQIPFSAWLPAAMAAPTPVSALVHSSTLVTAGVYLVLRNNYFILRRGWSRVLLWLGLITITIAGVSALFEVDIKKVIALSTLSQLGVIFFSLGLNQPFLAFFHLISHAYFKAMLFMAAGAIIHRIKEYQDLRKMGGGVGVTPGLGSIILIRNLSLCGMPFLSGFYSKDIILELIIINELNIVVFLVGLFATLLTVVYSCRLTAGLFSTISIREAYSGEADFDIIIAVRIRILVLPSIIGGWFLRGLMGSNSLVFLRRLHKLCIIILVLRGGVIILRARKIKFSSRNKLLNVFHQMWFLPLLFRVKFTDRGLRVSKARIKFRDFRWTEKLTWKTATGFNQGQDAYFFAGNRQRIMSSLLLLLILGLII